MVAFRPMDATLDGYAWLPRMIDKSRAARAGTLGSMIHPCPVDRRCLALLGIDVETFGAVVARAGDDGEVLAGLRAVGIPSAEAAWFDAQGWEDALQEMVWRSNGETISDRDARTVMILHADDAVTVTWSRYVGGERGPDLHLHRAHTDAFYVLTGALSFAVGPEGERRVRATAGTFVSAPAGVAHSFFIDESDGDGATWLNVHTPDAGFAAYLRGARDGEAVAFDSFSVPGETEGDRGRPVAEAIVVGPDAADGLLYDSPELRVVADRFRVDITVPGAAAPVSYCRI